MHMNKKQKLLSTSISTEGEGAQVNESLEADRKAVADAVASYVKTQYVTESVRIYLCLAFLPPFFLDLQEKWR